MRYRLTFICGAAFGYVLGARAGRERYEQLRKTAQRLAQNPAVRNAAESAALQGRAAAVKAADSDQTRFGDRLPDALSDKVADKVRSLRERSGSNGAAAHDDWGSSRN